eukprot:TRINITY_DN3062_c0_g1_i3.p2 TRINITY_DN3062_c0_g1~~TRINITY_DN3062_c0_g1_i3.p2  ORF type:complete len:262 (+),score=31.24 TRINITY_DN3062_c0_g1_i3:280-1065(+)
MARAMGRPRDGINTGLVPLQLDDGERREPDIEDDDLRALHDDGGHVPGVLLVPTEPNQGRVGLGALVDDGGVLLIAEIENPNGAVSGDGGEDADAAPGDVVDFFVVCDELRIDGFPLDVPNGAGGVDAGCADALGLGLVPVEGGEGSAVLAVLVAVEEALEYHAVFGDAPDAEEIAGCGEEIGFLALFVGDEDGFGRGVRVFEGEVGIGSDLTVGIVELDDLDSAGVLLEEAGDGESIFLIGADAPVHGVDVPGGFVCVNL